MTGYVAGRRDGPRGYWVCACDCGKEVRAATSDLQRRKGCGCRRGWKHGHSKRKNRHKLYSVWQAMRQRCRNTADASYPNYGGRGITVDARWNDFTAFVADMGERPPGTDLGRRDNDGPYSKANCEWQTRKRNLSDFRRSRHLTFRGETRHLAEWARLTGLSKACITARLARRWSVERALMTPLIHRTGGVTW